MLTIGAKFGVGGGGGKEIDSNVYYGNIQWVKSKLKVDQT
jgi:hypothetical protein